MYPHHVTLRELHRQDLLDEAADKRRVRQLAPTIPTETPCTHYQIVTLRPWIRRFVAKLRSAPLKPQVVTH